MTAKELLKPRFEVIADYPNSKYEIGDIIEAHTKIYTTVNSEFYYIFGCKRIPEWHRETFSIEQLEKYPNIFRKLEWDEYRTVDQMPKFVVGYGNEVFEVQEWNLNTERRSINTFKSNDRLYFFGFTPSVYKPIDYDTINFK